MVRMRVSRWVKPPPTGLPLGLAADALRGRGGLLLEDAHLLAQVRVLRRTCSGSYIRGSSGVAVRTLYWQRR
jgi:hypothetical protein